MKKFESNEPRSTNCTLINATKYNSNDPSIYYALNSLHHFLKLRQIVKEKDIDVILSANILPSLSVNFLGVPVVFDYLDHLKESASVYYSGVLSHVVKTGVGLITDFNLSSAKSIITVTEELKDFLSCPKPRDIIVIPNGVDTELLKPLDKKESGLVLGYVGSLEGWVDLESVILCLPFINDVTLLIIGPGLHTDYGDRLKQLVIDQGVSEKVQFLGPKKYEDLGKYISLMDIGLNPLKPMLKNRFSAGGKVFNYLACDRPVLSSDIPSLKRILGDNIFYYKDKEDFIRQVALIRNMDFPVGVYREIALKYDWVRLAKEYEDVLIDAAGTNNGSSKNKWTLGRSVCEM
jgi:glycosyltransferase involved in cell wall biosynthesis